MKYVPKDIPEGINTTKEHPLKNFAILLGGVGGLVLLIYWGMGLATDWSAHRISFQQERDWFSSNKESYFGKNKVEAFPEINRIQGLVNELSRHHFGEKKFKFNVEIIKSKSPNAFMAPGGNMGVTTGLVGQLDTENELAFVLCHEIGHFYHRHVLKRLGRVVTVALMSSLLGISEGGSSAGMGLNLLQLRHSREAEAEADVFALECMATHYGHVRDFDRFFSKLQKDLPEVLNNKVMSYVSTHPYTKDRIDGLLREIKSSKLSLKGLAKKW